MFFKFFLKLAPKKIILSRYYTDLNRVQRFKLIDNPHTKLIKQFHFYGKGVSTRLLRYYLQISRRVDFGRIKTLFRNEEVTTDPNYAK
jgi:hypothetical protein